MPVEPMAVQRMRVVTESKALKEPDREIDIFPDRQLFVIPAETVEVCLPEQGSGCGDVMSAAQQLSDTAGLLHRSVVFKDIARLVDLVPIAMDDGRVRMAYQQGQRFFQKRRLPKVILIEKCQEGSVGMACTHIASSRLALILNLPYIA